MSVELSNLLYIMIDLQLEPDTASLGDRALLFSGTLQTKLGADLLNQFYKNDF